MIELWLNITDDPITNMEKHVEMGVRSNGVKKKSISVMPMTHVSKGVIKHRIIMQVMDLLSDELDVYLDNVFRNDSMLYGAVFDARQWTVAMEKMNEVFRQKATCRLCKFYENGCPLQLQYNERGELFLYPNRICNDFEMRGGL